MSCRRSKQTKQNRNTDPITLDSRVNIYESRLYVQIYTHNSYIKIFNILRIPYRYLQILKRKEKNYSIIIRIRFYPYLSYHKILFNNFIIIHIYIYTYKYSHTSTLFRGKDSQDPKNDNLAGETCIHHLDSRSIFRSSTSPVLTNERDPFFLTADLDRSLSLSLSPAGKIRAQFCRQGGGSLSRTSPPPEI